MAPRDDSAMDDAAQFPDPQAELQSYLGALQTALQPPTRSAAKFPAPSDLDFHRSLDRKLARNLDAESGSLFSLVADVVEWIESDEKGKKGSRKGKGRAGDAMKEDVGSSSSRLTEEQLRGDRFGRIGDLVDDLLEKADVCLDEFTGKIVPRFAAKAAAASNGKAVVATAGILAGTLPATGPLPPHILNAPMKPPQRGFTTKPDNRSDTLWKPRLRLGKPNAKVPLDWKPADESFKPGPRWGMYSAEGSPLDGPYYYEITHSEPPDAVFELPSPVAPPPMDPANPTASAGDLPFTWIDTKAGLHVLLEHLKEERVTEIAIDLEHHNYRSFQGIVCLMQLSTRWGDWIIDTVADEVREHAEILNVVMTDPQKVKVLHGADHDVLWLQRDLGIYLVNLFDTYHATNVLQFPAHGLAFLLARYCDFEADKRYQLADWRIRPLPNEMLYYARSDTHSLLYIYDCLRTELLGLPQGRAAVKDVFERSKGTATKTYAKEIWDEKGDSREGWRTLWKKWGGDAAKGTDTRTLEEMHKEERLVRRLHKWRDEIARESDESTRFALSAKTLLLLASRAPTSPSEALTCLTPAAATLQRRAPQLAEVIRKEVQAWEADQAKLALRRAGEVQNMLLDGPVDGVDDDVGEPHKPGEAPKVEVGVPDDKAIVASLWAPFTQSGDSSPAASQEQQVSSQSTEPTPPVPTSRAFAFASSLFGGKKKSSKVSATPVSTGVSSGTAAEGTSIIGSPGLARFIAADSKIFSAIQSVRGLPSAKSNRTSPSSLFAASQIVSPAAVAAASESAAAQQRVASIQASLGDALLASATAAPQAHIEPDDSRLAQPESVAFVAAEQRATSGREIFTTADEHREKTRTNSNAAHEEEGIVEVGKKKKSRWTAEKKRKRDEEQRSSSASGLGDSIVSSSSSGSVADAVSGSLDSISEAKRARKAARKEKAMSEVVPFDYSSTKSVLDAPLPPQVPKKSKDKNKKDMKDERSSRDNKRAAGGAPRKKNEMSSGNRSFTFGS